MTRQTQASIDALLGVTPAPESSEEKAMPDTVTIDGSCEGFNLKFTLELQPTDYGDEELISNIIKNLARWGVAAAPQPVAAPIHNLPPQSLTGLAAAIGGQSSGGHQYGCPVHGSAQSKPAFRGPGFECSGYSTDGPTQWSKDKPATMRDGSSRWYCTSKWN